MRVALVHDWLVANRGGEKVLHVMCELFPHADVFTLLHTEGAVAEEIEAHRIQTSFLQSIPRAHRVYRHLLPVLPAAIQTLDVAEYDLVLSSSHCVAKGIRTRPGQRHLCYVHAPMRYMWDLFDDYFGPGRTSLAVRAAAHAVRPYLRSWDVQTAARVDRFVANSHHIARKVARFYGRDARVVHPPVDLETFAAEPLHDTGRGDYYLWFGALVPYKRVDIAIRAFAELGRPLWIAGTGPSRPDVADLPPNIRLLGHVPDEELVELYRNARALVFTAEEDFGLTPLEAQATGCPVIALGRGGALETVTPETGVFFPEPTASSLVDAVERFERWRERFRPEAARANASRFSAQRFKRELLAEIADLCGELPPGTVEAMAAPARELDVRRAVSGR